MRRHNKDKQKVTCEYFTWLVGKRNGIFYADGRGNLPALGRFSLGTSNPTKAMEALKELDRVKAVEAGKSDRSILSASISAPTLTEGRTLYMDHVKRPIVTGGARQTTHKRYRAVFDKFEAFCTKNGIANWSQINRRVLERYAAHLDSLKLSQNTIYLELTTLIQTVKWLVGEKHLPESCRIKMKLVRDKESTTYCWKPAEFQAIVSHCLDHPDLHWLGDICLALGLTGMRISELAQLRASNVDFDNSQIRLIDESRRTQISAAVRQQTTKNKCSRSFPIHEDLKSLFRERLRRRDGLVFQGPRGGKVKPDTIRNILIKDVLQPLKGRFPATMGEKGFEHGRLHSFRHFFCSQCANNGVPERVLMSWLGHADAEMVRRYYHLDAEESQRQMNRVSIPVVNVGKEMASEIHETGANSTISS